MKQTILPREAWLKHAGSSMRQGQDPQGAVIHHTAGTNVKPQTDPAMERRRAAGVIQAIHLQHTLPVPEGNGWADIGYSFVVTRSGLIWEARRGSLHAAERGMVIRGAHAGNNEVNSFWWGVCLEGDFTKADPPAAMLASTVELLAWLFWHGEVQSAAIQGHRDVKATECPGGELYRRLPYLRAEVRKKKLALMTAA